MSRDLVKAAGLLLTVNIGVKLLGFVREMVIAGAFGASAATDAYLVAYTIPYFFQAILGYAFVSALLPQLTACWQRGDEARGQLLGSSVINLVSLAAVGLTLLGLACAPLLVRLTAPQLAADTARLAVELTRIIFPSLLFMTAGLVVSAVLNSRYRFAAAACAPGVASLGVIAAVLLANGRIHWVAWGTLAGFLGFLLVQLLDLGRANFRWQPRLDLSLPETRRVLWDILPIVLGLSVNQIYVVVNRILASGLAEGSISALNYANKLMGLPLGLFVAAITTAVFPALADQARQADRSQLRRTVSRGLAMILLIVIPAAVGLMLLDQPVVRLLFERGSFTARDTLITAQALLAMAPGLVFLALSMLLMRVCYALDDVRTPLLTGGLSVAVNVGASLLLTPALGHVGLAWANSLAAGVNALLMLGLLARRLGFVDAYLRRSLRAVVLASACLGALVDALNLLWLPPNSGLGLLLWVGLVVSLAAAVYFLLLRLLKTPALEDILASFSRRGQKAEH